MPRKKKKRPPRPKVVITLSPTERMMLLNLTRRGVRKVRVVTRAKILLLSDEGETNASIVKRLRCAPRMICNVRRRYQESSLVAEAIEDAPRPGQPKKITPHHEAFVVATACTDPPPGHNHWTLPELARALLARYKTLRSISDERIRRILLASQLKPWREKNVVCS